MWSSKLKTEGLNTYQKASTYARRSQLLTFTGIVLLLASVVAIRVVRSNQSINIYHPNTSQLQNLLVLQQQNRNYVPKCTKWPLAFRDKSCYTFNSNNFTEVKAGNVRSFIWEGNSILWFLEHACKYPEIW